MKTILPMITTATLLICAACDPIEDPWVEEGEMQKERARSEEMQKQLVDRLHYGQSDR